MAGRSPDACPSPTSQASPSASTGCVKKRRIQYCTFCKNHKEERPKKGHMCPYKACECLLCELLRKAQTTMRHQQRVWRHLKYKLQLSNGKFQELTNVMDEKGQVCDKCRNHNELVMKKNHTCPHAHCKCQYCSLTYKRRELMKHLQRVRRSNLTTDVKALDNPGSGEEIAEEDQDQEAGSGSEETFEVSMEDSPSRVDSAYSYEEEEETQPAPENEEHDASLRTVASPPLSHRRSVEEVDMLQPLPRSPVSRGPKSSYPPPPLIPVMPNQFPFRDYFARPAFPQNHYSTLPSYPEHNNETLHSYREEYESRSESQPLLSLFLLREEGASRESLVKSGGYGGHAARKTIKFGVEPEDFHLRHSNWAIPSSGKDSSRSNSSSSASFEQEHPDTYSGSPTDETSTTVLMHPSKYYALSTPKNDAVSPPKYDVVPSPKYDVVPSPKYDVMSPEKYNDQLLLYYNMTLRHMNPTEAYLRENHYYGRKGGDRS